MELKRSNLYYLSVALQDSTLQFSSGKWGLIAEILREILSKMLSAAKVVGRNITKAVNDMHNWGTMLPLKSCLESSMDIYG